MVGIDGEMREIEIRKDGKKWEIDVEMKDYKRREKNQVMEMNNGEVEK